MFNDDEKKERRRENWRRWYSKNKKKIAESKREYYKTNLEKLSEYSKKYNKDNREKLNKYSRQYRENNNEKKKEYEKKYKKTWRENNRGKYNEYNREYYKNNSEHIREVAKLRRIRDKDKLSQYRKDNKEKINKKRQEDYKLGKYRKSAEEYCKDNKEKIREQQKKRTKTEKYKKVVREYYKNNLRTNVKYNLNRRMRRAVDRSIKDTKNGRHWEDLVGYSLDDLIKQLKSTLPENHTWQDFLDGGKLHIDHIIPISVFEFDKPEDFQFQECWSLKNLRLLPARENIIKSNKIIKPFQLLLKI